MNCYSAFIHVVVKGRHGDSLSLFIDLKQRVTKPSRTFCHTVGNHCSNFTIVTGRSLYMKCGYLIPAQTSANAPLRFIAYISKIAYKHILVGFRDSTVVNIDISPNF